MVKVLLITKPHIIRRYMIVVFINYHQLAQWLMKETNYQHVDSIVRIEEMTRNETIN